MFAIAGRADAAGTSVRVGAHPGFGRVVFDMPDGQTGTASQDGDRIAIRFAGDKLTWDAIEPGAVTARNLRRTTIMPDGMDLIVTQGTRLKVTRLGNRLVVDLLDAMRPVPIAGKAPPVNMPPVNTPSVNAPSVKSPDARPALAALPPIAATAVVPAPEISVESLPAAPAAATPPHGSPAGATTPPARPSTAEIPASQHPAGISDLAPTSMGRALSLPFSAQAGAAAFQRGDSWYVVFDERRPIDFSGSHDGVSRSSEGAKFAGATVQLLPEATVLRLDAIAGTGLVLRHEAAGWQLSLGPASPPGFVPRLAGGSLMLAARDIGRVVAVPDPNGGGILLVGTLRQASAAVPTARRSTEFILWPTWLGVVVEPVLDTLRMRAVPEGFLLSAGVGGALATSDGFVPADQAVADADGRPPELTAFPPEVLLRRMQAAVAGAAGAPARSRTGKRLDVARSLLALGMGVEAQGAVAAAVRDDPRASDLPELRMTAAMAALLAGRVAESDGLLAQSLDGNGEVAFWRGVRAALLGRDVPAAATALAFGIGRLIAYPAPLRDRLLGLVGETLAEGGQAAAFGQLDKALPGNPRLALARAMLPGPTLPGPTLPGPTLSGPTLSGASGASLAGLDAVAAGADRRMRFRAARLAAETRLARQLTGPAAAADALERLFYAWRDDPTEIALRERAAALRAEGGATRPAIALLRETARLWPDETARLRGSMTELLTRAIAPDARPVLPPLEFVSMVEDNADLLPSGFAGEPVAEMLADRLSALDLPRRAAALLGRVMAASVPGTSRAILGARLAALLLSEEDAPATLAALRDSDAPDLPVAVRTARGLTAARAHMARNDRAAALADVAPLTGPAASELRAALMEQARDWAGAMAALAPILAALPDTGPLDAAQGKTLLRMASDAAQAGDEATLAELGRQFRDRIPVPELARVFAVLTQRPVTAVADLARAGQEATLARQLPAQLDALAPRKLATR